MVDHGDETSDPLNPAQALAAEAAAIDILKAAVIRATDIGTHAIEYGLGGWEVFPLRGKAPAISRAHPKGVTCRGECGRDGHGLYDATTDVEKITRWWGGRYRGCNIGVRPPATVFVLDIDPQHGGDKVIDALEAEYGPFPETLTTLTGRDGGRHLYWRRPAGDITGGDLPGCDIKDRDGYLVAAPSRHPDTGRHYRRIDAPIAAPPAWLVQKIRPAAPTVAPAAPRKTFSPMFTVHGPSIADDYTNNTTWTQVLTPHGWRCDDPDPDADGAKWLHPTATSACSATVRNGCLFVYSTNTPFTVTTASNPHGYTRFRAHAVLDHGGDLKAAARALRCTPERAS